MKKTRNILLSILVLSLLTLTLVGCGKNSSQENDKSADDNISEEKEKKETIKVGTFSTSKMVADAGVEPLEEMGYEVEVVVFDDAVMPNTALQEGSIDINIFQHTPYLEAYMETSKEEPLTMVEPLLYFGNYGLYSIEHETLDDIPKGATISLYSDASNIDRGLRILDTYEVIKLDPDKDGLYNEQDIIENPKNIKFIEVAFGTAVRALEDVDAAMAAATHILAADMDPKKALALEEPNDDFACGVTARTKDLDTQWLKDVMEAYTSDHSREYIKKGYKGASIPLF